MTEFKIQDMIAAYGSDCIRVIGDGDMLVMEFPIYDVPVDDIEYKISRVTDTSIRIFPIDNPLIVGARTHKFQEFNQLVQSGDYKIQFVLDNS